MAKRITQTTFDAVVKENCEEFGMGPEEAVADAVSQFLSQGVDLTGIIKSAAPESSRLQEFLALSALLGTDSDNSSEIASSFTRISVVFADQDMRRFAGQNGVLLLLIRACERSTSNIELLTSGLRLVGQILDGQPDLLSPPPGALTDDVIITDFPPNEAARALCTIIKQLEAFPVALGEGLWAVSRACIKHEGNRQTLIDNGVADCALAGLRAHKADAKLVVAVAEIMRVLTLDDDVRVPFGKAHSTARAIVTDGGGLTLLVDSMAALVDHPEAIGPLASAVARLTVRNEFCQQVVDLGGLTLAIRCMSAFPAAVSLQQVKLLINVLQAHIFDANIDY